MSLDIISLVGQMNAVLCEQVSGSHPLPGEKLRNIHAFDSLGISCVTDLLQHPIRNDDGPEK